MKGTRPLDNHEIRLICDAFDGVFAARNRGLFLLGVSVGGRISELLALRVSDVYQNHAPVSDLLFVKSVVKGGEVSRAVPVNSDGRLAISEIINWHVCRYGEIVDSRWLFPSRLAGGSRAMHRSTAQRLYDATGDIYVVREMLGHKSVLTTQRYLGVNYAKVREGVESMVAMSGSELNISTLLSNSDMHASNNAI